MNTAIQQFNYTVRMAGDLSSLVQGPMVAAMENTGELVVSSNNFNDYDECITAVSRLLSSLSSAVTQKNGRSYVIVSKKNPAFDDSEDDTSTERWDKFTVLRLYVADAEILKEKSTLTYTASADVKVAESSVDLIKNYSNHTKQ